MKIRTCNLLHSAPALTAAALFIGFLTGMIALQESKSKLGEPGDPQLWLSRGAGSLANFYSAVLGPTPQCAGEQQSSKAAQQLACFFARHFGKLVQIMRFGYTHKTALCSQQK